MNRPKAARAAAHTIFALALSALLALVGAGEAAAQLGLNWYTMDGGGHTFGTGDALTLGGTAGQPDAGRLGGGPYSLAGGFWLGGGAPSSVDDPLVGPGDPGIGDGEEPIGGSEIPTAFRAALGLNNPFQHRTGIQLDLPESREVTAQVFDQSGRLVRTLYAGWMPAGYHLLAWDGSGPGGRALPSGSYLLRVRAGDAVGKRRVVLLR
ncbi:MAG: hypothetical protein GF330_08975 [Candidatus Eisenbacteria bacterium]|nr:hypothetical protein [Candidatus Eisenbacteria bacterium]